MSGKFALIIGNQDYDDPLLNGLRAPEYDVRDLAALLEDPEIGEFAVVQLLDRPFSEVRRAISDFLIDRKPEDTVLIYFSGHGIKSRSGNVYLAVRDTQQKNPSPLGIDAYFLRNEMQQCYAQRQVLILDCCYSGAFARISKGVTDTIDTKSEFVSGFGQVVITATNAVQVGIEADRVIGDSRHSLFTHYLIEGLRTGDADGFGGGVPDGVITDLELYEYAFSRVDRTKEQVPQRLVQQSGPPIEIARNPQLGKVSQELQGLLKRLRSPFRYERAAAATALREFLIDPDADTANYARQALKGCLTDPVQTVREAAQNALSAGEAQRAQPALLENLATQKADEERRAAEAAGQEKRAHEEELKRITEEKAEAESRAEEALAREEIAREELKRIAAQKDAAERQALQVAERERVALEGELKRIAAEKDAAEQKAAAAAEREKTARQREEAWRVSAQKAEGERQAAEAAGARVVRVDSKPLSEGWRVLNTFISPSRTFADLNRKSTWWAPWVLISLSSLCLTFAMDRKIGFDQIARNQITHSRQSRYFSSLPPDTQTRQVSLTSTMSRYIAYSSSLTILLYYLIPAVVLKMTFGILGRARFPLKTAYAIVMFGMLPSVVERIFGLNSLLVGIKPELVGITQTWVVADNLAFYFDRETTGRFFYSMASAVDLINLWIINLIGTGFACTSKVKRSTAVIVVAVWYLVFKLAASALASL